MLLYVLVSTVVFCIYRCVENCEDKFHPGYDLELEAVQRSSQCASPVTQFEWSVVVHSNSNISDDMLHDLSEGGRFQQNLHITKELFTGNMTYLFVFRGMLTIKLTLQGLVHKNSVA